MKNYILIISLFISSVSLGQKKEDKEKEAFELAQKAIELIDFGKVDQSIELLKKSIKIDPTNFNYPYELGFAYNLKKRLRFFEGIKFNFHQTSYNLGPPNIRQD